jgi:chemotaxis protein MotB
VAKIKKSSGGTEQPIIIIKRIRRAEDSHHGGAWKVAYADFVTAMMAFFLLLWLLSITTIEEKKQIAAYFSAFDPRPSKNMSGAGGVLAGTAIAPKGSRTMTHESTTREDTTDDEEFKRQREYQNEDRQDAETFKGVEDSIRKAIETAPGMKELSQNLLIDMTPEGLRIQLLDQVGKPMFPLGSPAPLPQTAKLLGIIAGVIKDLPNKISIVGRTDSILYGKDAAYTNWELSADRANASRRTLLDAGYSINKIENVQGRADREPLDPATPDSPRNRRISITLLKQSVVAARKNAEENLTNGKKDDGRSTPKTREDGVIYFP